MTTEIERGARTIHPMDRIPGAGFDGPRSRRPGVPMELSPPRPAGAAHWDAPERQHSAGEVLKRKSLDELTPVFSTATPPRGLSGLLRRAAYEIPEHHTSHWFVLLLADRVDALEHAPARLLPLALPLVLAAAVAIRNRLRSSRKTA